MIVYMQATTGKLHRRKSCSVTSRTRYDHFPVDFTPERAASCERCAKCWDGFNPNGGLDELTEDDFARASYYICADCGHMPFDDGDEYAMSGSPACPIDGGPGTYPNGGLDELTEDDFARASYYTCADCGHIETRQAVVEPPSSCENCGGGAFWTFGDLDAAEEQSQEVLERG